MKPKKLGTVQTVDMQTGEVIAEKKNAMTLLPPPPGVCQVCAVDHAWDAPHNQQSLYYQMHFHADHGRWPTWTDAMSHCTPEVQAEWKKHLIYVMQKNNMPVPDDLMDPKPAGR